LELWFSGPAWHWFWYFQRRGREQRVGADWPSCRQRWSGQCPEYMAYKATTNRRKKNAYKIRTLFRLFMSIFTDGIKGKKVNCTI
jgi:hypothetical protein